MHSTAKNLVLETIRRRRSARRFKDTPVGDDVIEVVLEAGRWAPSFSNLQPWKFIVVRNTDVKKKLQDIASKSVRAFEMQEAPAAIVVCVDPEKEPRHYVEDGSAATQNMMLATQSLGLATFWVGVFDTPQEPEVKKVLRIPETMRVISILPIGVAAESRESGRMDLKKMVYHEEFGKP
ncbi:MAG: nitroreductase family protein [Aigarchaeota archaeon]|nr:nitroreductase family protein [Aigarchaeota archaeon]